ncbi:MAG: gamma-glutamyltransferase [Acetobacteraceae bacterium]|nr:gamma-glutamyltransferase [Acetobacteraceae bacterium]
MVVSAQHLATEAGVAVLRGGGNAVDAAVAVGYALAVVHPCCGNIGGGGFMTLRLADGRTTFLDFRETAPAAATRDMYLDADGKVIPGASLVGWRAVGVPGSVAGLDAALTQYGTMPRAQVMAAAIRLARDGFVLVRGDTDIMEAAAARLRRNPEAARIFLRPDGTPFQPGDRLVQPDLARTLEAISARGPEAFYHGAIPTAVAAAARAGGGVLSEADFAGYKVREMAPLSCPYRSWTVVSAPPPSSGGTVICMVLGVLEGYDIRAAGFNSARTVHLMTEALRHAFLDRNTLLGDPDFVKNPLERLLSRDYAVAIRAQINPDRATPSRELAPGVAPHERPETTHYSVADSAGNLAAVTYTINGGFGAGVVAPGTGFLLNNEMDDFTVKPGVPNLFGLVQGEVNAIAPGKRPLSSMSPTLLLRDGQPYAVLGSPGGARIISITLQVILNLIDHGMELREAVDAPRIHHQWLPDELYMETRALSADTRRLLEAMGYKITEQRPWGAAAAIVRPRAAAAGTGAVVPDAALSGQMRPGLFYGANDDRRPAGLAAGP